MVGCTLADFLISWFVFIFSSIPRLAVRSSIGWNAKNVQLTHFHIYEQWSFIWNFTTSRCKATAAAAAAMRLINENNFDCWRYWNGTTPQIVYEFPNTPTKSRHCKSVTIFVVNSRSSMLHWNLMDSVSAMFGDVHHHRMSGTFVHNP